MHRDAWKAPTDRPGRRPRTLRGERTRATLVAAARRVFERDGYLVARLSDITSEAGCSAGTFYTYFDSKEEILQAVFAEVEADMLHPGVRKQAPLEADPEALISASNRAYLEAYQRNAALMRCLEQVSVIDEEFQRLRNARAHRFILRNARAIRDYQARGLADPGLDPELASRALSGMVSRLAFSTFVLEDPVHLDDLVEVATRLWVNALGLRSYEESATV